MTWPEFFGQITTTGLILAVVGWLARSLGTAWIDRMAENHKAQLRADSERELAELRSDLEKEATEHRIRFSRVHEKQAGVIAEVFGRLEHLHMAFRQWVAIMKPASSDMNDLADKAVEAYQDFQRFYYENAIWLDRQTCDAINEILGKLWDVLVDMTFDVNAKGYPKDGKIMKSAFKTVTQVIPKARGELDRKFRAVLGVKGDGIELPDLKIPGEQTKEMTGEAEGG